MLNMIIFLQGKNGETRDYSLVPPDLYSCQDGTASETVLRLDTQTDQQQSLQQYNAIQCLCAI